MRLGRTNDGLIAVVGSGWQTVVSYETARSGILCLRHPPVEDGRATPLCPAFAGVGSAPRTVARSVANGMKFPMFRGWRLVCELHSGMQPAWLMRSQGNGPRSGPYGW
uniref:Uncharacterized protein n=1 Tax=Rubinisphaera brasiliensis (strain ATCC 49424 / DSM 5305 / JCM 21570 / IAM 15109 / NBRC 103401 / IFAM 1448) TaxID=756272 RepID=F0SLU3_RUBBR|nr:hypothetical protein Plabr_1221 [Rubinisphaera brasiliensis DSM 5305]